MTDSGCMRVPLHRQVVETTSRSGEAAGTNSANRMNTKTWSFGHSSSELIMAIWLMTLLTAKTCCICAIASSTQQYTAVQHSALPSPDTAGWARCGFFLGLGGGTSIFSPAA
jgi:hypothetical protein